LSLQSLYREIGDWNRFQNRRRVASYSGLCPGVTGTGGSFTNLSINKHGNRRIRPLLVELAWLMYLYQPEYRAIVRWKEVIAGRNRVAAKKAIVAVARNLMVDLWRIETGRATPESLGLKTVPAELAAVWD
jgi:transposase